MPFIAQNKNNGERIDITKFISPREELKHVLFECRLCKIQMFIRRSPKGTFHFVHQRSCTSDYLSHPETPEHLAGKSFVASYVLPKLTEYANFICLFEEPLHEVKRIADIVNQFPMGWWVAHEIQLSSITSEKLEERTRDYLSAGVDVIWWLGKRADTEQNRQWAIKTYGFSPFLIFKDEEVTEYGYGEKYNYLDEDHHRKECIRTQTHKLQDESKEFFVWPHLIAQIGAWWLDLAFARYYQVWKKGNNDRYQRALLAGTKTIRSFAGRIGAGNKKSFRKMDDMWCIDEEGFRLFLMERDISILSKEAITSIKEKAKKYQSIK